MENENRPFINTQKVILAKSPSLGKWLPRCLFSAIKKLICEESINRLIALVGNSTGWQAAAIILKDLRVSYNVEGEENIPNDSAPIFVGNHPLGGLDGIIYVDYFGRRYDNNIQFPVNDVLMHLKMFNNVFVPINKYGPQAREASRLLNEAYQSNSPLITFPSGMVSRLQNGKIMDLEWKKNVIQKAVECRRNIVPIRFEGANPPFFYLTARWREKLGIRFNYELLLLPKALFKSEGNHFTVRIGKPISYTVFDNSQTTHQWAQWVKQKVYEI